MRNTEMKEKIEACAKAKRGKLSTQKHVYLSGGTNAGGDRFIDLG